MVHCFAVLLQRAGPALLRSTRTHSTLLCYTLQWAGTALLRSTRTHGTLHCYTLNLSEGGWACANAPDSGREQMVCATWFCHT